MKSRFRTLLLAAALVPTTWSASADARGPSFDDLPLTHPIVVPEGATAPRSLPSDSTVEGLYPAAPPTHPSVGAGRVARSYNVFTARQDADAFAAAGHVFEPTDDSTCFTTVNRSALEPGTPWSGATSAQASFHTEITSARTSAAHEADRMWALHVERLVREEGGGHLVVTDVWFDGITGGMKVMSRSKVPLVELARGPKGVAVLAARHARGVEFVVTAAEQPKLDPSARAMSGSSRQLVLQSGFRFASSDCGHLRFDLEGAVEGETAVIRTEVVVGVVRPNDDRSSLSSIAKVMFGELAPKADQPRGEVRFRPLSVFVSSSRTSSDPHPVLSARFGWAGRPRTMEF